MDWKGAIEVNRAALVRVVAEIFLLLQLVLEGRAVRLPREIYLTAAGLLRPAESALRRLIVIAARGLTVALPGPRTPQPRRTIVRTRSKRTPSFRLFDSRKRIGAAAEAMPQAPFFPRGPRIHSIESFLASRAIAPRGPDSGLDASRLCRRFTALKHALETLPRQAQRLARWRLRRARLENPKFRSPLRPGPPPGGRQRPRTTLDLVLQECHALAHHALSLDSS